MSGTLLAESIRVGPELSIDGLVVTKIFRRDFPDEPPPCAAGRPRPSVCVRPQQARRRRTRRRRQLAQEVRSWLPWIGPASVSAMLTVVASENGKVGLPLAWQALRNGASALDAVEIAARAVEDNPDDHSVGYAGHPNIDGVVELDASIMDGATRRAGAVGGLRGYRHAITVARAVMERTPHALIVGDGAAQLAREIGETEEDLLTDSERAYWQASVSGANVDILTRIRQLTRDPRESAGTVDFLAIDSAGHIASAVSTSGWAFKHPGRLGDSPVIGAGNYCDDRYGAAACTGWGELAIRAATAHTAVMAMARGASPTEAAALALRDLFELPTDGVLPLMHIVVVSPSGEHAAATTLAGARYAWQDETVAEYAVSQRLVIEP